MELSRGQRILIVLGLAAIFLALVLLSLSHLRQSQMALTVEAVAPPPVAPPPTVAVHVVGAVAQPGVYWLPERSRVGEAVARAGGMRADANPASVNLAAYVADGMQVVVGTAPAPGGDGAYTQETLPEPDPKQGYSGRLARGPESGEDRVGEDARRTPREGVPPPAPRTAPSLDLARTAPVSLTFGTKAQLESIPEVGPSLATNIIYYRTQHGPFRNVSELLRVPGFGPARLESVRPYVTP